jgi:uncharacterized protein YoxC
MVVENPKPVPDPTSLTTAQLDRAIESERDYVNAQLDVLRERLDGIDRATRLLNETVNRVPTDVQKEVAHLRELSDEKFDSIAKQFRERDSRSERESRDNKVAVDAAFAAQKEAAAEQNKSNTLAITKSEVATSETISKLAELFKTETKGLADKLADLRRDIDRIENRKVGAVDTVNTQRLNIGALVGMSGFVLAAMSLAVAVMIALTK